MLSRILLDPSPDASGGGAAAPTPAPAATPTPAPAPAPAPAPEPRPAAEVRLSGDEYRSLLEARAALAAEKQEKARVEGEREAARLKAMAEKGEGERALAELRAAKDREIDSERKARGDLEAQILRSHLTAAITDAVGTTEFVSTWAAAQTRREIESRLESVRDASGAVVVREKGTHRPVTEAVGSYLTSEEAAHCVKSKALPGSGSKGGAAASPTPKPGDQPQPKNLGEALMMQWAQHASQTHGGLGLGLGRRAMPNRN